ncbi:MAG: hypothetical protein A2580_09095 [Hydrogenophilales bacterium RIFOXYD1_FULL_62_11]|nr:MAG: hypothetical protein A2580_09095 [Hydrogenophilales bacterium RIFOXYD1_FULL_62_11]
MSQTTRISDHDYFVNNGGLQLDWLEPPQLSADDWSALRSHLPYRVDDELKTYGFAQCEITVDIGGPAVYLERCLFGGFNFNFGKKDSVLLADNTPDKLSIHLLFNPPVQAIGSQVSATGPLDVEYLGLLAVRLESTGEWEHWSGRGVLNRIPGSAPFIGAAAKPGERITEVWFDVVDANNANGVNFIHVAINDLYFLT